MKKYRVTYSATFQAVVDLEADSDSIDDVVSDIDIPEGGQNNSVYEEDSFDVIAVEPFDGDSDESDDESTSVEKLQEIKASVLSRLSERIQEDLICLLDSQFGEIEYIDEVKNMACQIVVDRTLEAQAGDT